MQKAVRRRPAALRQTEVEHSEWVGAGENGMS